MSVEDDAVVGRMARDAVLIAIILGVPMWLFPRLGLWGTPRVVVTVAWCALVALTLVIAEKRNLRRWEERWVEAERRRVGADRAPTLEAFRAGRSPRR
jgi:hypothetical protein